MEFKRDIYKNLVKWKQDDTGKVLQVSGALTVPIYLADKLSFDLGVS